MVRLLQVAESNAKLLPAPLGAMTSALHMQSPSHHLLTFDLHLPA